MAKRIIVWSDKAVFELRAILEYFNFRNKSKVYSLKLNATIQSEIKILLRYPEIGKKTDILNVRGFLIENYFIFYEIKEVHIVILSVWDTRQNPEQAQFK
ncbi:MAG: type II toxin-antitoxin system RelE/ParE family toxin [Flavobacterium sp.]|nr:type II toxin-antitoxin system RelE/ParE family toxin [Flavobacterium sp.]